MRTLAFANRVTKEIIRDPLSLFFGLAFPLILLLLLSVINANVPVDLFNIADLAPGIAVFGLSFMALFAAQVLSKDRATSFLPRLLTTPMTSRNFMLGYMLPLVCMAVLQAFICLVVATFLGLSWSVHMLLMLVAIVPISLIFISLGLLAGTLLSEKAAVASCGAILTNFSAWLSGIWFDIDLMGETFKQIAYALPFVHAVKVCQALIAHQPLGNHWIWVVGYAVVLTVLSITVFQYKKGMR
ncbi:ABC transporter permease [Kurthia massiliensis]|uniref:ABC transporter permease n=1 Tax=Kurthia massiliensis TaxID=1033739 RepID=UPI00028A0257|nr:ABC transporter permease [Kurthia massiliensis]